MALERWEIDSGHSGIYFSIRHMMLARIHGQFSRWSGTLLSEQGDLARASMDILIDASSLETGLADRDAHLKSADFLNTARYPEMTFTGRVSARPRGKGLRILGQLTALGVAHDLTFAFETAGRTRDPWGHERAGFTARGSLDRRTLGLTWNQSLEAGGVLVGDQVDFEIEVEAVLQSEPASPQGPA